MDGFGRVTAGVRVYAKCATKKTRRSKSAIKGHWIFRYVMLGSRVSLASDKCVSNKWRLRSSEGRPTVIRLDPDHIADWVDARLWRTGSRTLYDYNLYKFINLIVTVPDYHKAKTYRYKMKIIINRTSLYNNAYYRITY